MASIPVLSTTRYLEIGTYIGQYFVPGAGELPNNVRVLCLVGKGDRYVLIKNLEFRRGFVYAAPITFSSISPFIADLPYPSNGVQSLPVRLFTNDGIEVPTNKWNFIQNAGIWDQIQILDSDLDPLALYYLDFQSTSREVVDPIPTITINNLNAQAQVRQITAIGTVQDQQEFIEYKDFFINYELDAPVADVGNAHRTTGFSVIRSVASGAGTLSVSTSANYLHNYNRVYSLEVTAAGGTVGTRTATLAWSAAPVSFGASALPATPLNPALQPRPEIDLDETNPASLTNQLLELGVVLDFDFGVTGNFVVGDMFYLQANGAGLIEIDPLLLNTNQYTEFSAVAPAATGTGNLVISSLPSAYSYTNYNMSFMLECIAVTSGSGIRTATFAWSGYTNNYINGSFVYDEAVSGSNIQTLGATGLKVTLSFGATNFVVGDSYTFSVKAPRLFYKGKESIRNTTLSIGTVTYPASNRTTIGGGWLSDTPEGRYGTWSADTNTSNGRFEINDGQGFYVRNAYLSTLVNPTPSGSRIEAGDKFAYQGRSLATMDFSLLTEVTETFSNPSEISVDTSGTVTGTVGAKYITLDHNPEQILSLTKISDSTSVSYSQIAGTPILIITAVGFSNADGDLSCVYRWAGGEPAVGQVYYMTAKFLRPDSFYNRPFLFLRREDALAFLSPSTVRNDLYIGADIAWDQPLFGLFVIQVKDLDDDGLYTKTDYRTAINAYHEDSRATDLVVLNYFNSLADQLNAIRKASDPFEAHPSLTVIGCPIGTPIGSEFEQGSLVFYSRRTLAVYGNSPEHGTRILVGSTRCKRTIVLEDGSSTQVTLDGSFIAAALSALYTTFNLPTETILKKTINSFDVIDVYKKEENRQLGGNNIIYFADEGNGVYRIMEDITTDPYSTDTLNINQMTQKQFVTRDMKRFLDNQIVSMVFPSAAAGIATIQGAVVSRLSVLETGGFIGRYQDAAGNQRPINPTKDVIVFRNKADPTTFHFGYNYFLATTGKRLLGLYTVNLPGGFPQA